LNSCDITISNVNHDQGHSEFKFGEQEAGERGISINGKEIAPK